MTALDARRLDVILRVLAHHGSAAMDLTRDQIARAIDAGFVTLPQLATRAVQEFRPCRRGVLGCPLCHNYARVKGLTAFRASSRRHGRWSGGR